LKRFFLAALLCANSVTAEPILLQSTTSTQSSGLYDHLLAQFTQTTGIEVRVLAVGTGQAIRNAQTCDADLLLVHAKDAEEAFVTAGYGRERFDLMYNDFVLIGPGTDPAQVNATNSIAEALTAISQSETRFVSRGDNSGTHVAERRLWEATDKLPQARENSWYLETGSGMGATLNAAIGLNAYTLTDRGTWLRFANKGEAEVLFEGDPALFNQYGLVTLNPDHCPNANLKDADKLVSWLLSPVGQSAIADYRINNHQLFHPNAAP